VVGVRVPDQRCLVDHDDEVILFQMPSEVAGEGGVGG
jgi:hypothetical protein